MFVYFTPGQSGVQYRYSIHLTTGHCIRMEAVYTLLELDRGLPEVFASCYDTRVFLRATAALLDGRKITDMELPFVQRVALKKGLKMIEGTILSDMLKENGLV